MRTARVRRVGLPYAESHICEDCAAYILVCPACGLHITEDTDAEGELTTNRYGEHYIAAHEGRES